MKITDKNGVQSLLANSESINNHSSQYIPLSSDEEQKILANWVQSSTPAHTDYCRVEKGFVKQAALFKQSIAIEIADKQYTYREIDEWSSQLASKLSKIKRQSVIGLCMEKSVEFVVSVIAALKADLTYLPLDPRYPISRIQYMLSDTQCTAVIINPNDNNIEFDASIQIITINEVQTKPLSHLPATKVSNSNPIACIIYTSGSTGTPKPVTIAHTSIVNLIMNQHKYFGVSTSSRIIQFSSISFDASISEVWIPLLAGGTLVIPDEKYLSGELLSNFIMSKNINILIIPPSILDTISKPKEISRYLKTIVSAGEALTQSVADKWIDYIDYFINAYGPTEGTVLTSFSVYQGENEFENIIGKAIDGVQIYIFNENLSLTPPGYIGEIYIGGAGVSPGYYQHPELDALRFIQNPFKKNDKLYKTGDLARWKNDGIIQYIGRIDRQVKLNGVRIELEEIENQLANHLNIELCAVNLEQNDNSSEKQLVVYFKSCNVEKGIGSLEFKKSIRTYLRDRLPMSMIPHKYVQLEEFPRLPNGKVNRDKLKVFINQTDNVKEETETLSEPEEVIRHIYANILRLNPKNISTDISFFDLGATSLQAIGALSKINAQFNSSIAIEDFFSHSEIKNLLGEVLVTQMEKEPYYKKITKLKSLFLNCLNKDPSNKLDDDADFFDVGGTSLSAIKLLSGIKKIFGADIAIDTFFTEPSINAIMKILTTPSYTHHIEKNMSSKKTLEDDLSFDMQSILANVLPVAEQTQIKNVLLTGANGFLGAYLLSVLLEAQSDTIVHCLMRSTRHENAIDRLKSSLQKYNLNHIDFNRIKIYEADLSIEKFGLQSNIYEYLSQKIDSIYHCASTVNHLYTYDILRKANVLGTIEIIKLANSFKQKFIHYVSALDIALLKNQYNGFSNGKNKLMFEMGYIQTKWASEHLLEKASESLQLPVNIFRPGNIIGDLEGGIMDPSTNHFLMLTKSCIQLGYGPDVDFLLEMTPVNIVAKAIVALSKFKTNQHFNAYNVHNPNHISWKEYVKILNDYGFEFTLVDAKMWFEFYLSDVDESNALFPFKAHYVNNELRLNTGLTGLKRPKTPNLLKSFSIAFPDDYLSLCTAYFKQLEDIAFL